MRQEFFWMLRYIGRSFVFQLRSLRNTLIAWQRFWKSYWNYKQLAPPDKQPSIENLYPCLGEDTKETNIDPVYFYQDSWAFSRIIKNAPNQHIDVGSHHKFVALLSQVMPVTMVDIRPLSLPLDTLCFKRGSILELPYENNSIESLSSLCVVEHIGLGRYGDPLDPDGTEKAISELKRVIRDQGNLYLSLPIDDEGHTFFNAHRTFTEEYITELLHPFKFIDKSYIINNRLVRDRGTGYCIGLYHLQNI